jgi:hypothetical protein
MFDIEDFWSSGILPSYRDTILLVCASGPWEVEVSFSAIEDAAAVADAIGSCLDGVLTRLRPRSSGEWDYLSWSRKFLNLDPRVQAGGPWAIVDSSTTPISLFGA